MLIKVGNDIAVVQSVVRVMLNEVKHLAKLKSLRERSAEALSSGEINLPSSQPTLMLRVGGASLCRDDNIAEILVLLDNCDIISLK